MLCVVSWMGFIVAVELQYMGIDCGSGVDGSELKVVFSSNFYSFRRVEIAGYGFLTVFGVCAVVVLTILIFLLCKVQFAHAEICG